MFFLIVQIADISQIYNSLYMYKVKDSLRSGRQMARRGNSVFCLGKVFFSPNSKIETFIMIRVSQSKSLDQVQVKYRDQT